MRFIQLPIKDAYLIQMDLHVDKRGHFQELYSYHKYRDNIPDFTGAAQINCSVSAKNVVRGIHKVPFFKLCTCLSGEIWDVIVDLRKASPTYLKWCGVWLTPEVPTQVYIPPECGHGFLSAAENSILVYAQGGTYSPTLEETYHYESFGIDWPGSGFILSEKDQQAVPHPSKL